MQDLQKETDDLSAAVSDATQKLDIEELEKRLSELTKLTADPNLWQDQTKAQKLMREQANLQDRVKFWRELKKSLEDLSGLIKLGDDSLRSDLEKQLAKTRRQFEDHKTELMFGGEFDEADVILSIHAGAGGTDAQDWAQMLLRMYTRWAENGKYDVKTVDQSAGEEAGIKSVTLEISGPFAYGKLKGEHGVHRLVRLSPFNADSLRQTSFAKVEVLPKIDQPDAVKIDDKDLKVDVYRSGGHGGQSVNTTDSAVRVTHLPSGITVAIQNERSQLQNKETAMTILRSKLAQLRLEQHLENLAEIKGPNQSAEWGNQIRSYVLHPYKQVKDLRSKYETSDVEKVLDGQIDPLINSYLEYSLGTKT